MDSAVQWILQMKLLAHYHLHLTDAKLFNDVDFKEQEKKSQTFLLNL